MGLPQSRPDLISLAAGFTDNAVLPSDLIREAFEGLRREDPGLGYLQYGSTHGRPLLRELCLSHLAACPGERLDDLTAEQVLITNGSQQALYLATQSLCDPGDLVLVEDPTYFVYLSLLQSLQVRAVGMPTDADGGVDREALSGILSGLKQEGVLHRVKAVYLMGYYSNPSSRCLSLEAKRGVAEVLQLHDCRAAVIEDAAYRDLHHGNSHGVPSVLSMPCFDGFPRLYLGTFTKPLATGLKVGYAVSTDRKWLEKLLFIKGNQDFGTAHFNQAIVEWILANGRYLPLLAGLSRHYGAKATLLDQVLEHSGIRAAGWHWQKPDGGLLFWLRGPEDCSTAMGASLARACLDRGVVYVPGHFCFASAAPDHFIRLSIGAACADKLNLAASRFCEAVLSQ
jgi:2-aminoadipate transaminase